MIEIEFYENEFKVKKGKKKIIEMGFGKRKGNNILLYPEEVLFLKEMKDAKIWKEGKEIGLNELLKHLTSHPHFLPSYFVFRDWKRRGLVAKKDVVATGNRKEEISYIAKPLLLPKYVLKAIFFPAQLMSITDEKISKELFEQYWFGQYGTYKAHELGKMCKFDIFETIYLMEKGLLECDVSMENSSSSTPILQFLLKHLWKLLKYNEPVEKMIKDIANKRIRFFNEIYQVYKTWRDAGYVVKTGFKFGTHFRIYFPHVKPTMKGKDVHSKHLLHVFPRGSKMLVSEWARVVRVAHSVRKTFLLSVPKVSEANMEPDWFLFHRDRKGRAEHFATSLPKFACFAFSEDEYLGAEHFSSALESALSLGCDPLIAIIDRETSITYYHIRKISLSTKTEIFCEIDWFKP